MKPVIFAGSASKQLGTRIAANHNFNLGQQELINFANSEIRIRLLDSVFNRNCLIVQSTSNPTNDNFIELFFLLDALKREKPTKAKVLIPYFGYARQNIKHRYGECVSMRVIAQILENLKADEIITIDIHKKSSQAFFTIPFKNLSALPMLAKKVYKDLKVSTIGEDKFVIGSPDQGGIQRAKDFVNHFYLQNKQRDIAVVEKKRNINKIHESKSIKLFGDVKNKTVILIDDVSTSGKTILNAAEICLKFNAKEVYAVVVHADFAFGVPKLIEKSVLKKFYTTNTIEKTLEDLTNYSKIQVLDISKIFVL